MDVSIFEESVSSVVSGSKVKKMLFSVASCEPLVTLTRGKA